MSRIEACRICLITDVKLERIQGSLESNIKNVFGCNIQFSSDLPDYACYECTALITKYSKFRKKYFMAQSLLFNILQNHGMVTQKEIKNLDRNASKLSSNLSVTHNIGNESWASEIKLELDPMEGIPELTVDIDEGRNDSASDDDVALNSYKNVEYVNRKNKKSHISLEKQRKAIVWSNDWEEPSNKKKKKGNYNRKENMTTDFDDTTFTNGGEENSTYLLEEYSGNELNETENSIKEHSTTYNQVHNSLGPKTAITVQILENQHIMMSKLASMSGQLERLAQPNNNLTPTAYYDASSNKLGSAIIENKKQLDEFENDLNDPEKKKMFHSKYSIFFKGRGQAINCAYILVDALFSRKFLTTCSWAGGSRGEESKIAFKSYKNTLIFIYELIQECDSNFSILDCYRFVKSILKNSGKRNQSKGMRMSTGRRRISPGIEAFEIDLENVLTNNSNTLEEET